MGSSEEDDTIEEGGEEEEVEEEEEEEVEESSGGRSLFVEGEKVLAYHGPLIYEAKVLKAEVRKKSRRYFVHYLGWSKNWDEWVGADRLMKYTEPNVEKRKKLFKDQSGDKILKGRIPQTKPKATTVTRAKKRKADAGVEDRDTDEPDQVMKIPLPGALKKQLVDDWEFVTQHGKLIKLPRDPNVDDILKKYLEFKAKQDGIVSDTVVEILNGLRSYFDKALPVMLLYKEERGQYADNVQEDHTNITPSSIYGAEHLLRLFVKLPDLLVYTNMEEDALAQLQQKLADFLKYLQKNQSVFFVSTYDGPKVDVGDKD